METLKYTYYARSRQMKVWAGESWTGGFVISYHTPNGYPRQKDFATAEACIKEFNRMTNNQTK